jgi:hypothetical protein
VIVPIYNSEDSFIFAHAGRLAANNDSKIKVLDIFNQIEYNEDLKNALQSIIDQSPENIELVLHEKIGDELSSNHDLMLVSMEGWHKILHDKRMISMPSSLIIRP